jgi:hypothetical protein
MNIGNIERNIQPHVVAGGFVTELHAKDEDGDSSFKLADDLFRSIAKFKEEPVALYAM